MQLIILSGRSGSGKSVALHMLEDLGYYSVDGLPTTLLPKLAQKLIQNEPKLAVSIDARNFPNDFSEFNKALEQTKKIYNDCKIIFLNSDDHTLLKRFSVTRRKHPLTNNATSLHEALNNEELLLEPLRSAANIEIDTNRLSIHNLREMIRDYVIQNKNPVMTLQFLSFGYKLGIPFESDYVFDVRCLPNPYWEPALRQHTGVDPAIKDYLESSDQTQKMVTKIIEFLQHWIPLFEVENRQYLTIAIGCTGGQHRSVYLAEKLSAHFKNTYKNTQVRHRDLP